MQENLESPLHLFQRPLYRGSSGVWEKDFRAAVPPGELTWDLGAILSLVSFGYACGDRTLVGEVIRRPWLSEVAQSREVRIAAIPAHGVRWATSDAVAAELLRRLEDELVVACTGRKEIFVLLSGGLDSRIVAGVIAWLIEQGRLSVVPTAVTWGAEDSRDVLYARAVADRLRFNWQYLPLQAIPTASECGWIDGSRS